MNYYGYMPITTDPVVLHLDGCKDWGALHQRLGFRTITEKTGMPCGIA